MKYLVLMILSLFGMAALTAMSALASEPQDSCAKIVAEVVADQAKIDLRGVDFSVPSPDLGRWDGGEVVFPEVPVVSAENPSEQIAVYKVMVDESCEVTIENRVR